MAGRSIFSALAADAGVRAGVFADAQPLLGMHQLARVGQRRLRIDGGLEFLVLDGHEAGGILGRSLALGHDGGDGMPVEEGFASGQGLARARQVLSGGERQVARGIDADHARHAARRLGVDASDARVGIGAEHQPRVQHAGERESPV